MHTETIKKVLDGVVWRSIFNDIKTFTAPEIFAQ